MNKRNKRHKITFPDGSSKYIYFAYGSQKERVEEVNKILDEWNEYCNENWITFNSGGYGITPEDSVKILLDNLSTYLLLHDEIDNNTLDYNDMKSINNNEIALDSFFEDDKKPEDIEVCVSTINKYMEELSKGDGKIAFPQAEKSYLYDKSHKRTKLDKFNDIYGNQANEYIDYIEDNRLPYMPTYWTEVKNNTKEINGVVDKNKPHKVKWVNVRVDRRFNFDDKNFRISKDAKQYLYAGHTKRYETYRDDFKMVKVLCFEQYGKYYFYDENIDEITEMVELEN